MESSIINIVIMCGGRGRRMRVNRQKCMLKVGEKPILEYLFEQISNTFGRARIILVVGYRSRDIRDYFGDGYKNLQLKYTPELTSGTRLALLSSRTFIKGKNFLSIDGNLVIKGRELLSLVKFSQSNILGTVLVSAKKRIAQTHAVLLMEKDRVLKIDYPPKRAVIGPGEFRLMDIGFYSKELFKYLRLYNVPTVSEVLKNALKGGKVIRGRRYAGNWFHFVAPEDLRVSMNF